MTASGAFLALSLNVCLQWCSHPSFHNLALKYFFFNAGCNVRTIKLSLFSRLDWRYLRSPTLHLHAKANKAFKICWCSTLRLTILYIWHTPKYVMRTSNNSSWIEGVVLYKILMNGLQTCQSKKTGIWQLASAVLPSTPGQLPDKSKGVNWEIKSQWPLHPVI